MAEIAAACRKYGLKFGFYYSHAYDWEHPKAPGNDWEFSRPGGTKFLYAQPGKLWHSVHPEMVAEAAKYVDEKAIPQILELMRKYNPDILWFDTPSKLPTSENLRILQAIRAENKQIVVNSRLIEYADKHYMEFGDYLNTGDRAAEVYTTVLDGETIPTTNESYGYSSVDKTHKEPYHFIELLIKSVAKNGNVLLNIGPKGDGSIDEPDLNILKEIGKWMEVYGESIYGCISAGLAPHSWGYTTRKENKIFLHIVRQPASGKVILSGVPNNISRVYCLADQKELAVRRINYLDWEIVLPHQEEKIPVIAAEYTGLWRPEYRFLLNSEQAMELKAFDAQKSESLKYGSGKRGMDYIQNWNNTAQEIRWSVKLNCPTEFEVSIKYAAFEQKGADITNYHRVICDANGTYFISFGDLIRTYPVKHSAKQGEMVVETFRVGVPQGDFEIVMRAKEISAAELMKFYSITLTPLGLLENSENIAEYDQTDLGD